MLFEESVLSSTDSRTLGPMRQLPGLLWPMWRQACGPLGVISEAVIFTEEKQVNEDE